MYYKKKYETYKKIYSKHFKKENNKRCHKTENDIFQTKVKILEHKNCVLK